MTRFIYVVLDPGLLAAAILTSSGRAHRILDGWYRGEFHLALTEALLDELDLVLRDPTLADLLPDKLRRRIIKAVAAQAHTISPAWLVDIDPRFDSLLSAAVEAGARLVVTADDELLAVKRFKNVEIVSEREFVERLTEGRLRPGGTLPASSGSS